MLETGRYHTFHKPPGAVVCGLGRVHIDSNTVIQRRKENGFRGPSVCWKHDRCRLVVYSTNTNDVRIARRGVHQVGVHAMHLYDTRMAVVQRHYVTVDVRVTWPEYFPLNVLLHAPGYVVIRELTTMRCRRSELSR